MFLMLSTEGTFTLPIYIVIVIVIVTVIAHFLLLTFVPFSILLAPSGRHHGYQRKYLRRSDVDASVR